MTVGVEVQRFESQEEEETEPLLGANKDLDEQEGAREQKMRKVET